MMRWRHVKRGTIYKIIGEGCFQTTRDEYLDQQAVTIYQDVRGGCVFVRPTYEFMDGRFERVILPTADAVTTERGDG